MQPSKAWIISDTIEKNKRIFKIPVYQRNYDWTNTECEKLYEDIIEAFNTDKKHFTGTIVYIIGEKNSSSLTEDLIIDGQQRLTSIMILLKALLDLAINNKDSIQSEVSDLIFNRHCDEAYKLKLKPVKADDKQFQALMQNNSDLYDKNSHIIRNYELFKKLINQSMENGLLLSDILEGMKKLEIVEIVLDKSQGDDPQVIFESINSTGLELSLADKIRNYVLMDDDKQDELFERYWLPLEEKIGNDDLADYFITFLSYKVSESISRSNAYSKFTKHFNNKDFTHKQILEELEKYAKYYSAFIGRKSIYNDKINKILMDFKSMDQTTIYPFLFDVFDDYEDGNISEDVLLKTLSFFRSYSLRRIVCEHSSNTLKGLYKTLYSRLFKNKENYFENYYDIIYNFFANSNTKDKLITDKEFYDDLIYKKLYTKKKVCKYLLASLENEKTNEKLDIDNLTIEHILPQKENALVWKKEIGNDYEHVYNTYLHTLGNLTITGYNSELGTKPFNEKKKIILELSKAKNLNYMILAATNWNEQAILSRAKSLAEKAIEIFKIEKAENINIIKKSSDAKIYSLDDQDDVKGTTPVSYTFCGENVNVKTYISMLSSVIGILYDLEPKIIERLAECKFRITKTERVYLTLDKSELRKEREIGNSGIFYESNLSSVGILQFIKALIEEYDFDSDDFEFICE